MTRLFVSSLGLLAVTLVSQVAHAVASAEFYSSTAYGYGRVEARIRFAAGDGVVSSFFLWKNGSEMAGTFWNELDFEKLGADCHVETNAIYGNPSTNHNQTASIADACGGYHTYAYQWTPEAIVWLVDGVEIRRETGATATAFADNASASGMQVRFNIWPGDASFGGNFSPSILPVHQYVDWVAFSSYANGTFTMQWREDFNGSTLPSGWSRANWGSPKNLSTHNVSNVNLVDGHLVLSLTADDALGPAGAMPGGSGGAGGSGGSSSGGSAGSSAGGSGATSSGGAGGSSSGGQSGTGGISQGGVAGAQGGGNSGGVGPTGGALSGGSSGTSGNGSGTGGTTNPGGNAGAGTSGGSPATDDPESDDSDESGGCSLSSSRRGHAGALAVLLGIAAIAALHRRRPQNWLKKSQTS
jgi:hypothetical protein